jgi:hypothetical protein
MTHHRLNRAIAEESHPKNQQQHGLPRELSSAKPRCIDSRIDSVSQLGSRCDASSEKLSVPDANNSSKRSENVDMGNTQVGERRTCSPYHLRSDKNSIINNILPLTEQYLG